MSSSLTPIFKLENDKAVSSIAVIDDMHILLDCGWNGESESLSIYNTIIPVLKYVLISNSAFEYVGALPYIFKHPDFKAQVYVTFPVQKMSQMVVLDHYFSNSHKDYALEDITAAWEKIITLKHSQKVHIKEKSVVFAPYRAGNNIGGAVWRITHNMQEIFYMPCFNPHPVKHIQGLDFGSIQSPAVLIMDPSHSNEPEHNTEELCEKVKNTLVKGGSVLIPVDASGSVLEILLSLEQYWETNEAEMGNYSLAFLGHVSNSTVEFAKSYLEWMNEEMLSKFEGSRDNPFSFKFIKTVQSIEEIQSSPVCILATPSTLSYGFSRKLFFMLANNPLNSIIFLQKPSKFIESILKKKPGDFIETQDEEIIYQDLEIWKGEETSTEISESIGINEEVEIHESYGPKLFEEKHFKAFAVCEWKHFCDEYGENMAEEEMELWQEETPEKINTSLVSLKSFSQTLTFKLLEEDKKRKHSSLIKVLRSAFINAEVCSFLCDFRANDISIKLTLAKIQPRKLIFIHSSPNLVSSLIDYCRNSLPTEEIIVAEDTVQLIASMSIHPIKLSEEFYNSMKFLPVDGYEVAYISGQVRIEQDQLHFTCDESFKKPFGYFLGNVKLGQLRGLLIEKGYKAEFRGGKLVINDRVILYKHGNSGGIQDYTIEGVMSKEYFDIRKIIYSQHIYV